MPNLKKTIARYNEHTVLRHDRDFAKEAKFLQAVTEPPFYAIKSVATTLGTLGGVKVNENLGRSTNRTIRFLAST